MAAVCSMLPTGFSLMKVDFRRINFFSDLLKEKTTPDSVVTIKTFVPKGFVDADSISAHKNFTPFIDYNNSDTSAFKKFIDQIINLKRSKGKIRIAWFGDSLIEGDILVQHVRDLLQQKFGGNGIGFIGITTNVPGFRKDIQHTFSSDWKTRTQVDSVKAKVPYGISGEVFIPRINQQKEKPIVVDSVFKKAEGSWVSYTGTNYDSLTGIDQFHIIKLYYLNHDSSASIIYSLNKNQPKQNKQTQCLLFRSA